MKEMTWRNMRGIFTVAFLGLLVSCGHTDKESNQTTAPVRDFSVLRTDKPVEELKGFFEDGKIPVELLYWNDEGSHAGKPHVKIDKKKQMGYFYRGDHLVGFFPVSTGKSSVSTPEGVFSVQVKEEEHQSYYGQFVSDDGNDTKDADIRSQATPKGYKFVPSEMPFFMRLVGNVGLHQGYVPGKPASHGCIRVPDCMAEKLYRVCPVGTKVEVVGDQGKHATKASSPAKKTVSKPAVPKQSEVVKPTPVEETVTPATETPVVSPAQNETVPETPELSE
jgi:hypothetical protein